MSAAPSFMQALAELGRQFIEDPPDRRILCIEVGLEATRNPKIGEMQQNIETFIRASFRSLFSQLQAHGQIAPVYDLDTVVEAFMTIADGMLWRRAVDPTFKADIVLPPLLDAVGALLRPVPQEAGT
jgi:hypothetical protein